MFRPTRRRLLEALAGVGLAGTAGCLSDGGPDRLPSSFAEDRDYLSVRDGALSVDVETYLGSSGTVRSDGTIALSFETDAGRVEAARAVALLTDRTYPADAPRVAPPVVAGDEGLDAYLLAPVPGRGRSVYVLADDRFVGAVDRPRAAHLFADDATRFAFAEVGDGLYAAAVDADPARFYDRSPEFVAGALTTTEAAVYRVADGGPAVGFAPASAPRTSTPRTSAPRTSTPRTGPGRPGR